VPENLDSLTAVKNIAREQCLDGDEKSSFQ
jgi:hypothetical protein